MSADPSQVPFTLGLHAARIENIEKLLSEVKQEQAAANGKLDQLVLQAEQVKGGYRALAAAGMVGGAVATGAIKFVAWLKGGAA